MLTNHSLSRAVMMCAIALCVTVQATAAEQEEPLVQINRAQLTLQGAEQAIQASRQQAEAMGVKVNIAVVDDGGHLLAFARMNGARPSSVYTSITKATSAALQRGATGPLRPDDPSGTHLSLAVERAAAASGGKFTTLKGGVPIVYGDQIIGAVGVGGATGEQDAEVAAAGVAMLTKHFESDGNAPDAASNTSIYGSWQVVEIDRNAVEGGKQVTIAFANDGAVTGSTGVNRYRASAKIDGQKINIKTGLATTRAAGPPAAMAQESKFLTNLRNVRSYRIDENDKLHLLAADGEELLMASPVK